MTQGGPRVYGYPESSLLLVWDGALTATLALGYYDDAGMLLGVNEIVGSTDVGPWLAHWPDQGTHASALHRLAENLWARVAAEPFGSMLDHLSAAVADM